MRDINVGHSLNRNIIKTRRQEDSSRVTQTAAFLPPASGGAVAGAARKPRAADARAQPPASRAWARASRRQVTAQRTFLYVKPRHRWIFRVRGLAHLT